MKTLMIVPALLLGVAVATITAAGPNGAADADLKTLNGVWIVQSVERDPPEKQQGEGKGIRCEIADGKVTARLPSQDKPAGSLTISVDSAKTPMAMMIKPDGEQATLLAIYKLDNGTLTICWKPIEDKRPPGEFSAKPGTGQTIVTLVREGSPSQQPAVPPEQKKRLELMTSKGTDASLTVLPVRITGVMFERETRDRVSGVVGLLLEQNGLKHIELGKNDFDPGTDTTTEQRAASLAEFIKKNPIATEYAVYAEYHADGAKHTLDELRVIVVDKTGAVVCSDLQTLRDKAFQSLESPDPMTLSVLLVDRLSPQLGLNEQTAKAAKPAQMAAIMDERSGLPPESERASLPERQKEMRGLKHKLSLMVFPPRVGGKTVDEASAADVAKLINDAGLCKAVAAKQSILLKAALDDPNELKALWNLARGFRDSVRRNPVDADYVLDADYVFNSQNWEQGIVHFVVCDRKGEWVIVDLQNSHQPDYRSIKPTSRQGCDKLLVKRLEGYLLQDD
jgi:uncharacterized protein (TIGR03067 family)